MRPLATALLVLLSATAVHAADPPRLLRHPSASADAVAFEFAGDIWTVARSGGTARRLTAAPGREHDPFFSPDGKWVAFSGAFEGNDDVYVVAATGGAPRRLTWHPGSDVVVGWSPDSRRVLFRSGRASATAYARLFTVGLEGGLPVAVDLPAAFEGAFSPDGARLAYLPHGQWQSAWKRYRGGQTTPIWIANLADGAVEVVPRDNSNDASPMWIGGKVYFLSDREGAVTLFAYDPATHAVARVLAPGGFDVKAATAGPGVIAYERFGELRLFELASGRDAALEVSIPADELALRPHWVKLGDKLQNPGLSPSGARAVFEARGEIFTVPAEKGDVRNVTRTPGVAERDPAWSPDGQSIAYFSDASGEYALHVAPQDGRGPVKTIALGAPPSFFYAPRWSPDSKKIAFHDKRLTLWYVDLAAGTPVKVDQDWYETPDRTLDPAWSPDSRFLVYTKQLPSYYHAVFAYELASAKTTQLTDGLADARWPVFDRSGKYLYFAATTNLGPGASWLDMSSFERPIVRSVYVAVLRNDLPSPLAPESDEERPPEAKKEEPAKRDPKQKEEPKDPGKSEEPVRIDLERLGQRTLALPVPAKNYFGLLAGKEGELFLLEGPQVLAATADSVELTVHRYSAKTRKLEKLIEGASAVVIAAKGEKLLYQQGPAWSVAGTDAPPKPGEGALKLDGVQALVDPAAEWRQMYREAWRIQRDFIYDPGTHGLDLAKAAKRYEPYLAGVGSRSDLNYLFEEMLGETTLGHTFVRGGDLGGPDPVKGGLLGCDFAVENGRYRFARVYDGESWNPDLRAPLTAPGVNVVAGEYLLAIDGRDVVPPVTPDELLVNTAGRSVALKVAADAAGKNARDVTVVPIESEQNLRHRAWVEDNRRTVENVSGGRLGYVYLPNTGSGGYTEFNRYYFALVGKDGVILDERHNGGGSLADYVIDHLKRPPMSRIATREGHDQTSPAASIYGPKVMIVNEMAGSGGDAMPWYFRKSGIGTLVGKRTWGGLVGIYDYPPLIDGGTVTAPRAALYGLEGDWEVENRGIAPDVDVELDPKAWREGKDSQLLKAIDVAMEQLKSKPLPTYRRPEYPIYHKSGDPLAR